MISYEDKKRIDALEVKYRAEERGMKADAREFSGPSHAVKMMDIQDEISDILSKYTDRDVCETIGHDWQRPYEDDGRDMNAVCERCGALEE